MVVRLGAFPRAARPGKLVEEVAGEGYGDGLEGAEVQASVGDRLHVHGNTVGEPDRIGEIVEVRGERGEPPFVVRFDDGTEKLMFPGPDAVVERA